MRVSADVSQMAISLLQHTPASKTRREVIQCSPAHVSGCRALAAASLVYSLDHHPAGAAHPALRDGERKKGRGSLRGVDTSPHHWQQSDREEEIKCECQSWKKLLESL